MSVSFLHPQMLVLLLLLPLAWRRLTNRELCVSALLRMAMAACAAVFLAGPAISAPGKGTDLVFLVDRSASCAARVDAEFRELLPLIQSALREGDRLAVVGFGREALLEKPFASGAPGAVPPVGNDGASNLADALLLAARIADPVRRTAFLYLGDGQHTGEDPLAAAVRARAGAYPFWHRCSAAGGGPEVAALSLDAPQEAQPRSAWTVRFSLFASAPCEAEYVLTRNGGVLSAGKTALRGGENRFQIRDAADAEADAALLSYRLRVEAAGDGVPENNVAAALVRIAAAPKILHVLPSGGTTFLAQCLAAGGFSVDSIAPEAFPSSPAGLAPYGVVVLENCPLGMIPFERAASLAAAVSNGLASLLVTGGANSFGNGGYHRSPLDPLLPVGMELRNELRRGKTALALALDRSGSMSAPAEDGGTKMDLANLGAAESIRLLAERDEVAVIAVDSRAHAVIPLADAGETERLAGRARAIRPAGEGIFIRTALLAAREELRKSGLANRQIILFADAADIEEQEGCFDLVRELRREGVGLSIVAMGEREDADAAFLAALAREGGSEALFSRSAEGLPALFTQEVMRVSRRGFVEERVQPVRAGSPLAGLREEAFPFVDGYNSSFPREGSEVLLRLDDEFATPILAVRNLGRTAAAAALFEIEGEFAGAFPRWEGAPELLVSLVRRLAPGRGAEGAKAYARARPGRAELEVEFDAAAAERLGWPELSARWLGTGGKIVESPLRWVAPDRAAARAALESPGHFLPLVEAPGMGLITGGAVSVGYPPEFAPGNPAAEERLLRRLAALAGGGEFVSAAQALASGRAAAEGERDVSAWALGALLLLFLAELAGRRLALFR